MVIGIIFAIVSGLLWGLIFIGPLLVPEYPGIFQAAGRYIAFGLISLPLSWYDRKHLCKLLPQDWLEAIKLVLTGHLLYYACLASAIQRIGAPISTAIIGTLPVLITISVYIFSDHTQPPNEKISCYSIMISIFLIGTGLLCVNISELKFEDFIYNSWKEYVIGMMLSIISVICWSWYALRNARWLRLHPSNKPFTWANAQGIVTLPLSLIVYCIICIYSHYFQHEFLLPFGPRPTFFILLMILIGFCCSWLGTFFWNAASQRLPAILMGPLIVFETIFGLIYAFVHRKLWPSPLILIGMFILVLGVVSLLLFNNYLKNFNYSIKIKINLINLYYKFIKIKFN